MKKILTFIYVLIIVVTIFNTCYSASLTWDVNTDASYYIIYIRPAGSSEWTAISGNIVGTRFEIPDMANYNTDYEFTIKAFNDCGNSSDYSEPVSYNQCVQGFIKKAENFKLILELVIPSGG